MMMTSHAQIILFWGGDFCALYNDAYSRTIGNKHPTALGRPACEGCRELWDDLEPLLSQVRVTGQSLHATDRPFYIEREEGKGEQVCLDICYSPIFDDDDSIGGVLCIVSETTSRVLDRRQAIADRERLWTIARDPFLVADQAGTWLSASPAWTEILGWSADQLIGRTSEWMEHPDDIARTRAEVAHLAEGDQTSRFENRFRDIHGRYHYFSWTAVPEGDLVYCVARDVTAEKEASAMLRETEEALRHAQKMETVGQLTGGLAHDFNNLLQIISGNLDIIVRTSTSDDTRIARAAQSAMAGAERAAVLTQRLLTFSRRQPLEPRQLDPNRLIADMADLLHRTLGETVELEIVSAPGLWRVEVDANQLENAILNLAINARDAMPEGGCLTIETANCHIDEEYAAGEIEVEPGQYVLIAVSDTGHGMTDEVAQRAFEPFFTTKDVGRGTGLGLSMVYGFIKQSGGHVRLYSELSEGTTVKIYLPRSFKSSEPVVAETPRAPPAASGHETILVCEDDDRVRAYTVEVLNELGYTVIAAENGANALEMLQQHGGNIDLLFTDVMLPGGMTGASLADQAKNIRPNLKILFTSGYARNAIVHHGRLDPGVELLPKPFSYTALATKLRKMLD
jgi:PAS domain S-box-containing protein